MSSDVRYSVLTDSGRVTIVRRGVASPSERTAALRPWQARQVLGDILRRGPLGDHQALVRVHQVAYADSAMRGRDTVVDRLIPRVLDALEQGRLLVVPEARADASSRFAGTRETPPGRAREVALGLGRLRGAIAQGGESYRIVVAGWRARDDQGERWEVVSPPVARSLLERWLTTASGVEVSLLREAITMLADPRSTSPGEGLSLLRRARGETFATIPDAEPALSPSQLRKQKADDWVEFVLLDDEGNPRQTPLEVVLSDGSKQNVIPDGTGLVRFSALAPGQCQVTIVKLQPAA